MLSKKRDNVFYSFSKHMLNTSKTLIFDWSPAPEEVKQYNITTHNTVEPFEFFGRTHQLMISKLMKSDDVYSTRKNEPCQRFSCKLLRK